MKTVNLEKLLPADIPQGERVLWHGRPEWVSLARRAYRVDFIAAYFAAMTAWNFGYGVYLGGAYDGALSGLKTALSGLAAVALLGLIAWLSARTTLYVVTSRRLVMKIGIALPIFFNLPFSQIASAAVRVYPDQTGDIPVSLGHGQRIAYLHLWPHARPFRFARPEPALRSVRRAAELAEVLSRALRAASEENMARTAVEAPSARGTLGEAARSIEPAAAA